MNISVKEKISANLALRRSVEDFYDYLSSLSNEEIIIDFAEIKSISRSFAHEYIIRKKDFPKKINEINIPENVRRMFKVVSEPSPKKPVFNVKSIKAILI